MNPDELKPIMDDIIAKAEQVKKAKEPREALQLIRQISWKIAPLALQ